MKVTEALLELAFPADVILIKVTPKFRKAARIGIEGLKLVSELRQKGVIDHTYHLLGETEE